VDVSKVWLGDRDPGGGTAMPPVQLRGGDVSSEALAYDFTRCDECGAHLEPESRLWGLCPACEQAAPRPESEPPRRTTRQTPPG